MVYEAKFGHVNAAIAADQAQLVLLKPNEALEWLSHSDRLLTEPLPITSSEDHNEFDAVLILPVLVALMVDTFARIEL